MNLENIAETSKKLREFEKKISQAFLEGKAKPPIHFSYGNEKELIKIFKNIKKEDWICTTYRNHYHALLRGIPEKLLEKQIYEGNSMHIMSREYNFVTSAIVGGTLPIALGIAKSLILKNSPNKVWAFCGDMAAETGIFHECTNYARRNDLPITFVIEDNGLGVNTPTQKVWGESKSEGSIIKYSYKSIFPHQGCGKEVGF